MAMEQPLVYKSDNYDIVASFLLSCCPSRRALYCFVGEKRRRQGHKVSCGAARDGDRLAHVTAWCPSADA